MALIGPNGAGKTTLLLHFNGLLTPTEGHILWEGRAVAAPGFDRAAWRRQVGFIFQSPCHQLFGETVAAEVAFGLRQLKLAPAEIAVRTREAMAAVGLVDAALLARSPFTLSYGEQRRVALAAVLAMRPRLLVLDEATAGLDARATQDLLALLDRLAERGTAVILATHDLEVARWAERVWVLAEGCLVRDGRAQEVLQDTEFLARFGLEAPAPYRLVHYLAEHGRPELAHAVSRLLANGT